MRQYLLVFMLCFQAFDGMAQQPEYRMQTRRFANAVWIRWSPPNQDWLKKHAPGGYELQRLTVSRDGIPLETHERYRLNRQPIRWDTANSDSDTMQLLKTLFFLTSDKTDDYQAILHNREMKNLAYLQGSLWLMRNFNLALRCGLGWADYSVKNNETYLYELRLWGDTDHLMGADYSNLADEQSKPQLSLKSVSAKNPLLTIESSPNYWGYHIERALDTLLEFVSMSELPFVNGSNSPQLLVSDTLMISGGRIFYRVAGLDVFGLKGPWSDTLEHIVLPELQCPGIENLHLSGDTALGFLWSIPDSIMPYLKCWSIEYTAAIDEDFKTLEVKKTTQGWWAKYPEGYTSLYLRPSFTDQNGHKYYGGIAFIQPIDSLPPPVPTGLHALCDSFGVVKIKWNVTQGAAHYRLYRSNYRNAEFTDHSHVYFIDTFYTDTVDLMTLQDTVFYAVTALDNRYNESGQCVIDCVVYDKIPPPPPAFMGYELTEKGYLIRWSGSKDAVHYTLHRQDGEQLTTVRTDSLFYLDSTGNYNANYTYYLTAADRNTNQSEKSAKLGLRFPFKTSIPDVPRPLCVNDTQNRKCYLMWEYPELPSVSHFRIMLKNKGKKKTIATAQAHQRQYCLNGYLKSEEEDFEIIVYTKNGMKSK
ncbi:MAG: hypothetical protein RIT07_860 [Bacteroidota bacterium]